MTQGVDCGLMKMYLKYLHQKKQNCLNACSCIEAVQAQFYTVPCLSLARLEKTPRTNLLSLQAAHPGGVPAVVGAIVRKPRALRTRDFTSSLCPAGATGSLCCWFRQQCFLGGLE